MDAAEFRDLVACCSDRYLSDFLHVSLTTVRRWKSGESKPPHSAVIALQWHLWGELSAIGGTDWRGFSLQGGKLHIPFFRRPFDPFQIQAMFFEVQLSRHYKREAARLDREKAALQQELEGFRAAEWAARKVRELI